MIVAADDIESEVMAMVTDVLDRRMGQLTKSNLKAGEVVLNVANKLEDQRESEMRVYFYKDGNITDAIEFHIYRKGQLLRSFDQFSKWFDDALTDVIEQAVAGE